MILITPSDMELMSLSGCFKPQDTHTHTRTLKHSHIDVTPALMRSDLRNAAIKVSLQKKRLRERGERFIRCQPVVPLRSLRPFLPPSISLLPLRHLPPPCLSLAFLYFTALLSRGPGGGTCE